MGVPKVSDTVPPGVSKEDPLRATIISCMCVSGIFILLRLYVHIRPAWRIWWDDALVAIAFPIIIGLCVVQVLSYQYGSGTPILFLTKEQIMILRMYLVISTWLWFWTVALTRMSIAFMILRVKKTGPWRIGLYAVIIFQLLFVLGIFLWDVSYCRPVQTLWDASITGDVCMGYKKVFRKSLVYSTIHILIDIGLSLVPIIFIRTINRSLLERILLSCLMGLGLITSSIAVVKLVIASRIEKSKDPIYEGHLWASWAWAEMTTGIIAACAPFLKAPMEGWLRKWHLIPARGESHVSTSGVQSRIWQLSRAQKKEETDDLEQSRSERDEEWTASEQSHSERDEEWTAPEQSQNRATHLNNPGSWGGNKSRESVLDQPGGSPDSKRRVDEKMDP